MISSDKPSYSLQDMKSLAAGGRVRFTTRAERFLMVHYDVEPSRIASTILEQFTEKDFVKSFELKNRPGTMADVYVGGCYDDMEWYVKAFIEDENVSLQIWSMCWDGTAH